MSDDRKHFPSLRGFIVADKAAGRIEAELEGDGTGPLWLTPRSARDFAAALESAARYVEAGR